MPNTFIVVHSMSAPSRPVALNVRYIQEVDYIAQFSKNVPGTATPVITKEHASLVMTNGTVVEVVETQAKVLDLVDVPHSVK